MNGRLMNLRAKQVKTSVYVGIASVAVMVLLMGVIISFDPMLLAYIAAGVFGCLVTGLVFYLKVVKHDEYQAANPDKF